MSSGKIRFEKKQHDPTLLLDACCLSIMHSPDLGKLHMVFYQPEKLSKKRSITLTSYPKLSNPPGKVVCFSFNYLTSPSFSVNDHQTPKVSPTKLPTSTAEVTYGEKSSVGTP